MEHTNTRTAIAALLALLLALAACATPANDGGDDGLISGACAEDTPDCEDTMVDGEPATGGLTPLAPGSTDGMSGMVAGDGLSVSEALGGAVEGVLAVSGFIVFDGETVLLCELLAESLPPQCGGASVVVEGLDLDDYPIEEAQNSPVRWTNDTVVVFGELVDGVLVHADNVQG